MCKVKFVGERILYISLPSYVVSFALITLLKIHCFQRHDNKAYNDNFVSTLKSSV